MSLTASDLIDEVRDLTFVGTNDVPDKVILRALARAEKELFEAVMQVNEEALADFIEFDSYDINDSLDNGSELAMPSYYLVIDGTLRYGSHPDTPDRPFFLVPARMKDEVQHIYPSGYLVGQNLYLRKRNPSITTDEWTDADVLTVRYIPVPEAPETTDDEFTLPDSCGRFLVLRGACYVQRLIGNAKDKELESDAEAAKSQILQALGGQDSTETWTVRVL